MITPWVVTIAQREVDASGVVATADGTAAVPPVPGISCGSS
jgi:hypothetical protein